jgi:hypothetical protein
MVGHQSDARAKPNLFETGGPGKRGKDQKQRLEKKSFHRMLLRVEVGS